jgi:hypothetical protein
MHELCTTVDGGRRERSFVDRQRNDHRVNALYIMHNPMLLKALYDLAT